MKIVSVGELFNVTQISGDNSKIWVELIKIMNDCTGDVLFDFDGVDLLEPWTNIKFKKLMENPRVHLKVYSSENIKQTVDVMCLMSNYPTNRVINEDVVFDFGPSKKDKQLRVLEMSIENNVVVEGSRAYLNLYEFISQLEVENTMLALMAVVDNFVKNKGIKYFDINTDTMFIQDSIIDRLTKFIVKHEKNGVIVNLNSEDEKIAQDIMVHRCISGNKHLGGKDKAEKFKVLVPIGTVGLLIKYKETKSKDNFGRRGEGKPVVVRPAIFRGIIEERGDYFVKIVEYNGVNFCTAVTYGVKHDTEDHPGLQSSNLKIPIRKIGLYNSFVGELYHFATTVQYDKKDTIIAYRVDDDEDKIVKVTRTIPEHIKSVLDEFGVDYNQMRLLEEIGATKRELR